MSKLTATATKPKIEEKKDRVSLEFSIDSSLSEIKKALPKADGLARRRTGNKLVIDGLAPVFTREKKRGRKAIVHQLCDLSSDYSFSDNFPLTSSMVHSYCEVLNVIERPENTKSNYTYFYSPNPLSAKERKLRASYALKQKAAFDPNNIKARQIIITGKADDLNADEIRKRLKKEGITSSRGNVHSNTAITRLLQDYFSLRQGFHRDNLPPGFSVINQDELAYDSAPLSHIQENVSDFIDHNTTLDEREDFRLYVDDKKLKINFHGPLSQPLYLDFIHEVEIIDTLQILPNAPRDNKICIDILKDTVLFPGLYLVRPYTLKKDNKLDKDYQTPFEMVLGENILELDKDIVILEPTMPGKRPRIYRK